MKTIFQSVIKQGGYDLSDMLRKIDSYHIAGKLTDQERDELYTLARGGADPTAGTDIYAKLAELEERIRKLEQPEGGTGAEAYIPGKWYYAGDQVTYAGTGYTCTAPEGQVCTWSPEEYPAYWEEQ